MIFHKPLNIVLILPAVYSTCRIHQCSTRFHISGYSVKNIPLKLCQLVYAVTCHIVLDIVLPAHYAKSRTRKVCYYHISLSDKVLIKVSRIPCLDSDICQSKSVHVLLYELRLVLGEIP